MAESTFGRLAVNDGKLVNRLRFGGRVTIETVERVMAFMKQNGEGGATPGAPRAASPGAQRGTAAADESAEAQKNFRFYDNRQKYLLFVNTCGEKWAIAERVA